MLTISAHAARHRLPKLLELVSDTSVLVLIPRNHKPMAWLVGESFMQTLGKFVDFLIEHEPALVDTLAIQLDDELREAITQGSQEIQQDKTIPIEEAIKD